MNDRVSCILATYNRYPEHGFLVDEAVFSFIVQDYEDKELLIINDTPGMQLKIDEEIVQSYGVDPKRIRIFNLDRRFSSLPEKIAWGIEQATGDWIMRWDDDDICLRRRISLSMEVVTNLKRLEWRCENYVYMPVSIPKNSRSVTGDREKDYVRIMNYESYWSAKIVYSPANTNVMSIWNKKVLNGKPYPGKQSYSGSEDQAFNQFLIESGYGKSGNAVKPEHIFYIYRWGVSKYHLSGVGGGEISDRFYDELGQLAIYKGEYTIYPRWLYNYYFVLDRAINELNKELKRQQDVEEVHFRKKYGS